VGVDHRRHCRTAAEPDRFFWAIFSLLILIPGAASPPTYLPLWLLTGCGALGGIAVLTIGIAPRGGIAGFVLGAPAARCQMSDDRHFHPYGD
jgi:hypothetical protein